MKKLLALLLAATMLLSLAACGEPEASTSLESAPTTNSTSSTAATKPTASSIPATKPTETAKPTETKPTESQPIDPKPTETTPVEPKPTEAVPTQPKPTEPVATQPVATQPTPTQPATTQPTPTQPKPTEPKPTVHTHKYTSKVTAPTCTAKGYTTYTCACGHSYKDHYTNIVNHSYVNGVCQSCGAKKPASEGLKFTLNADGASYAVYKGSCTDTEVVIPATHEGLPVTCIGFAAFGNCSSITSVIIPDSVIKIDQSAFFGCTGLTSVIIPDSITKIGSDAFSGCTGLTSIHIPTSLTKIGEGVFSGCSGLTSITIPVSVTSITRYSFNGCSGLERIEVDPANSVYHSSGNCLIKTASKELVLGCKNSIIPTDGSVTSISRAFAGCTGLTSIIISDGITYIAGEAFISCKNLTSITIPSSVIEDIGMGAFSRCDKLYTVIFHGTKAQWNAIARYGTYGCGLSEGCIIYCTDGEITV